MKYGIDVPTTGTYNVSVSFASPAGGLFEFRVDGQSNLTVNLPATGSYGDYQNFDTTIDLEQGTQILEIRAITGGYNLEAFSLELSTAAPIPGNIVAADYDRMSGVMGDPVGFIDAGDWMEYDIEVSETGVYDVSVRFASPDGGDQFEFQVNGETRTVVDVPATGGFGDYQELDTTLELEQGTHVLRMQAITDGYNLDRFTFVKRPVLETTVLSFSDFEDGFGIWTDGGKDCALNKGRSNAYQSKTSVRIRDNSDVASSFYHTDGIDLRPYEDLKVEFWFKAKKMTYGRGFVIEYYDGASWQIIADFKNGTDFFGEDFNAAEIAINKTDYHFSSDAKLRFRSNGRKNKAKIFVDDIKISASGYSVPSTSKASDSEGKSITLKVDNEAQIDPANNRDYDMILYPNSVERGGSFRVRLADQPRTMDDRFLIEVYTLAGQRIFQERVQGQEVEMSAQNFSKGLYLVKSTTNGNTVTKKLIVN